MGELELCIFVENCYRTSFKGTWVTRTIFALNLPSRIVIFVAALKKRKDETNKTNAVLLRVILFKYSNNGLDYPIFYWFSFRYVMILVLCD